MKWFLWFFPFYSKINYSLFLDQVAFNYRINKNLSTETGTFVKYNDSDKKECTIKFDGKDLSKLECR